MAALPADCMPLHEPIAPVDQRPRQLAVHLRWPLLPDRPRGIDEEPQLRALVRRGERIAAGAAGEAALRANRQPLELDVLRRFVDAAPQVVHGFERGRLAADDPQYDALSFR